MPEEFKGKVVVITGGSRGIGRGIALAFAREGAQTVLASSSEQNLAAAAKAIAAVGPEPLTVAGDLRQLEAVSNCSSASASASSAATSSSTMRARPAPATSSELPDEPWLDGFALKFFGAVRLTRLFWPLLKASEGHVVNIIGGAARTVEPEFLIGGSVNAATANFTKGLVEARHARRRPRQRHPSRPDRDRAHRAADTAACGRAGQFRSSRCAPTRSPRAASAACPRPRISPRSRCSCAPSARGKSRARRSRSTAAATPGVY